MDKMVKLRINGQEVEVPEGTTILEAARTLGIDIPTLCHLEELKPSGSCRICCVEVKGMRGLVPSCAYPVAEGMEVSTHAPRVQQARRHIIELLLANHPDDCLYCPKNGACQLQELAGMYGIMERKFIGRKRHYPMDSTSPSIERDPDKCILCGRCVRVCKEIQTVGAIEFVGRGFDTIVLPAFAEDLHNTSCVNCGQCTLVCPTGALRERRSIDQVVGALRNLAKHVVVQVAPAVRVALGEEFGLPYGTNVTGQMVTALRQLGFDAVFDTQFSADLTIMEEGTELIQRLSSGENLPLLTSCSPGWIKYIEHFYPDYLPNLSTCKSPQQMLGAVIKTYYAKQKLINPEDIYVVSVMPCTAKKFEATRPEMEGAAGRDVDAVLTTRELALMIKQAGISFTELPPGEFDDPLGASTGAGALFGTTGGVAEAALRTVYYLVEGKLPEQIEFTPVRGLENIKEVELVLGGKQIRCAVAHGLGAARYLMEEALPKMEYHFVEIMACPGGCIAGGGQPVSFGRGMEAKKLRQEAVYALDRKAKLRFSHENPAVQALYEKFLGEPGSEKAHELLHTHYVRRGIC